MVGFQTAVRMNLSGACNQSKSLDLSRSQKPWEAVSAFPSSHQLPGASALAVEGQVPVPISVNSSKVRTIRGKPRLPLCCSHSTLVPCRLQETGVLISFLRVRSSEAAKISIFSFPIKTNKD